MPRTHAALPRLFVEHPLTKGEAVALDKDQSLYLATVLRKETGDAVVLFNGRDGAWLGRINSTGKKSVVLELSELIAPQPMPADLWYGFAPLKAARLDYVIQKATEMGASIIQPVITQFTQVSRIKLDRMRANAIEAAEQCEVLNIPLVEAEVTLERLVTSWSAVHGERLLILADETASSASPVGQIAAVAGRPIGLLIGPEGGFSDAERALLLAQPFVIPVSLGPRILRADTAAVAALTLIQAIIGDWR